MSLLVKRPTFRGVQALRGFAACIVVIHHATQVWSLRVSVGPTAPPVWLNGAAGVDIFFVISGFVMAVATIGREHKTHPARSFLGRRLIRIIPLYWIMTFLFVLKLELVRRHPNLANGAHLVEAPFGYIVCSLFFIPYRNSFGNIQPLLVVGWTLSFEMFFYLLFSGALALRLGVARTLAPIIILIVAAGMFHRASWPTITVLADPLLLEFLAGLLLGHTIVYRFRCLQLNKILLAILAILAAAALLSVPVGDSSAWRILAWGLPAFLLVQAVVLLEDRFGERWPRWTLLLGDASYSLYLSHYLVIAFLIKILTRFHFWIPGVVRRRDEIISASICLTFSVLVAVVLHLFIEKPITKILRHESLSGRNLNVN